MFNYDSIVISLILAVDSVALFVAYQNLQQKRKQYLQRRCSLLLKSLGITSNV